MWRRRRVTAPLGPGRIPPGPLLQRLAEAHQLLNQQRYVQAADLFEELARGAQIRDPNRAPQLYLQAGRACLLNRDVDRAMRLVYHGLGLLAAEARWPKLIKLSHFVALELHDQDLPTQAAALQDWVNAHVSAAGAAPDQEEASRPAEAHPLLPLTCPSCGGPLRPDEIEWTDAVTAECQFCGSMIRSETAT